jgi:hypothetical protein
LDPPTITQVAYQACCGSWLDAAARQCQSDFVIGPITGNQAPGQLDIRLQDSFSHRDAALFGCRVKRLGGSEASKIGGHRALRE